MKERTEILDIEQLGHTEFPRSGRIASLTRKIIHARGIDRLVDYAGVETPVHSDRLIEDGYGRLSQHITAVTLRAFGLPEKQVTPTLLGRRGCKVVQVELVRVVTGRELLRNHELLHGGKFIRSWNAEIRVSAGFSAG